MDDRQRPWAEQRIQLESCTSSTSGSRAQGPPPHAWQGYFGAVAGNVHAKKAFSSAFMVEFDAQRPHVVNEGVNVFVGVPIDQEIINIVDHNITLPQKEARVELGRFAT